jgi:hypothetical protein
MKKTTKAPDQQGFYGIIDYQHLYQPKPLYGKQ